MIQQIFKIILKQWKKNSWIILEMFLVFALMWYIVDFFSILFLNSRTPVGFDIENTYVVNISHIQPDNPKHINYKEDSDKPALNFLRIVERIRNYPDIEKVSIGQFHYPYCTSNISDIYTRDTLRANANILYLTPEYFDVFNVHPADGGSPEQLGEVLKSGVIISRSIEEHLFPGEKATEKVIFDSDSNKIRIVGVTTYLKENPYTRPGSYLMKPFREQMLMGEDESHLVLYANIAFRTRPGIQGKDFADKFMKEMKTQLAIGNYYVTGISSLTELRNFNLRVTGIYESLQNRGGFTIFFLANIFLGVIGTFWLRIEKRKEEIGLRMAVGSSRNEIMKQMMGESFALMLIALFPALLVWINLILTDILPSRTLDITWQRFLLNTLFTIIPITIVIALATWYPARRSMSIQPAEALHYE